MSCIIRLPYYEFTKSCKSAQGLAWKQHPCINSAVYQGSITLLDYIEELASTRSERIWKKTSWLLDATGNYWAVSTQVHSIGRIRTISCFSRFLKFNGAQSGSCRKRFSLSCLRSTNQNTMKKIYIPNGLRLDSLSWPVLVSWMTTAELIDYLDIPRSTHLLAGVLFSPPQLSQVATLRETVCFSLIRWPTTTVYTVHPCASAHVSSMQVLYQWLLLNASKCCQRAELWRSHIFCTAPFADFAAPHKGKHQSMEKEEETNKPPESPWSLVIQMCMAKHMFSDSCKLD